MMRIILIAALCVSISSFGNHAQICVQLLPKLEDIIHRLPPQNGRPRAELINAIVDWLDNHGKGSFDKSKASKPQAHYRQFLETLSSSNQSRHFGHDQIAILNLPRDPNATVWGILTTEERVILIQKLVGTFQTATFDASEDDDDSIRRPFPDEGKGYIPLKVYQAAKDCLPTGECRFANHMLAGIIGELGINNGDIRMAYTLGDHVWIEFRPSKDAPWLIADGTPGFPENSPASMRRTYRPALQEAPLPLVGTSPQRHPIKSHLNYDILSPRKGTEEYEPPGLVLQRDLDANLHVRVTEETGANFFSYLNTTGIRHLKLLRIENLVNTDLWSSLARPEDLPTVDKIDFRIPNEKSSNPKILSNLIGSKMVQTAKSLALSEDTTPLVLDSLLSNSDKLHEIQRIEIQTTSGKDLGKLIALLKGGFPQHQELSLSGPHKYKLLESLLPANSFKRLELDFDDGEKETSKTIALISAAETSPKVKALLDVTYSEVVDSLPKFSQLEQLACRVSLVDLQRLEATLLSLPNLSRLHIKVEGNYWDLINNKPKIRELEARLRAKYPQLDLRLRH